MTLTAADLTDQVLGCVLGGAVGDALGAPFEVLWSRCIPEPPALLSGFAEYEGFPCGQYTDDTQLTVATLQSVVRLGRLDPSDVARSIARLWRSQAVLGRYPGARVWANALARDGLAEWTTVTDTFQVGDALPGGIAAHAAGGSEHEVAYRAPARGLPGFVALVKPVGR